MITLRDVESRSSVSEMLPVCSLTEGSASRLLPDPLRVELLLSGLDRDGVSGIAMSSSSRVFCWSEPCFGAATSTLAQLSKSCPDVSNARVSGELEIASCVKSFAPAAEGDEFRKLLVRLGRSLAFGVFTDPEVGGDLTGVLGLGIGKVSC